MLEVVEPMYISNELHAISLTISDIFNRDLLLVRRSFIFDVTYFPTKHHPS